MAKAWAGHTLAAFSSCGFTYSILPLTRLTMKALSRRFHATPSRSSSLDEGAFNPVHGDAGIGEDGDAVDSVAASISGGSSSGISDSNSNGTSTGAGQGSKKSRSLSSGLSGLRGLHLTGGGNVDESHDKDDEQAISEYLRSAPIPQDPIEFITMAYAPLFNTAAAMPKYLQSRYKGKKKGSAAQGVPWECVKKYHVPRFFSEDFFYEANGVKKDMSHMLSLAAEFQNKESFASQRTIERAAVIDRFEPQSLERASVFFHDETLNVPQDGSEEAIRMHLYSIVTIDKGKIVHDHVVVDRSPMMHHSTDLQCCVQ